MQKKVWAAIGLAAIGWGTAGVAVRAALDEGVPPYAMVTIRGVIAAIGLYFYLVATRGGVSRKLEDWKDGSVMALTNLVLPYVLFTLGYQYASAGFMGILAALIPLGTAILAHYFLDHEPLHIGKLGGLVVALAGVALLMLSGDSGLESGGRPLLAFVFGIGAVIAISIAGIYAKRRAHAYDPVGLTTLQFLAAIPMLVVALLVAEGLPGNFTLEAWLLILYMSIAGSMMPFLLYFWVLQHVTATKASLIGYAVPLVSLVSGIILLDEQLQFGIAVGGALILAGVVLTDRSERKSHAGRALGRTAP